VRKNYAESASKVLRPAIFGLHNATSDFLLSPLIDIEEVRIGCKEYAVRMGMIEMDFLHQRNKKQR